jgi:hypothetical protein
VVCDDSRDFAGGHKASDAGPHMSRSAISLVHQTRPRLQCERHNVNETTELGNQSMPDSLFGKSLMGWDSEKVAAGHLPMAVPKLASLPR